MVEQMQLREFNRLREMYDTFHGLSPGGWVFEAIDHFMFSDGWRSGAPMPQYMSLWTSAMIHSPQRITFFILHL